MSPSETGEVRRAARFRVSAGVLLALLGWAIADAAQPAARPPLAYEWNLPRGFPTPKVPADNPMSAVKVELGRYLFYDTRMSVTGTFSCATCHQQERAFADDKRRGVGATGAVHPRGAMSLTNVAYNPVLGWANPTVTRLEDQALAPMFGTNPIELGLSGQGTALIEGLSAEPRYRTMFPEAFPDDRSR
ncbi:MAG: cytochrome c peroxidase [Vicinamibacterales bacterium]